MANHHPLHYPYYSQDLDASCYMQPGYEQHLEGSYPNAAEFYPTKVDMNQHVLGSLLSDGNVLTGYLATPNRSLQIKPTSWIGQVHVLSHPDHKYHGHFPGLMSSNPSSPDSDTDSFFSGGESTGSEQDFFDHTYSPTFYSPTASSPAGGLEYLEQPVQSLAPGMGDDKIYIDPSFVDHGHHVAPEAYIDPQAAHLTNDSDFCPIIPSQMSMSPPSSPCTSPAQSPERKASIVDRKTTTPVSGVVSWENGKKIFTCTYGSCTKWFRRAEHLNRHVRSVHTFEKPFACPHPTCTRRFSRTDNLSQHMRIHDDPTRTCANKTGDTAADSSDSSTSSKNTCDGESTASNDTDSDGPKSRPSPKLAKKSVKRAA